MTEQVRAGEEALLAEVLRAKALPTYHIETEHDLPIRVVIDERDRCCLVQQDTEIVVLSYDALNALVALVVMWAEGRVFAADEGPEEGQP